MVYVGKNTYMDPMWYVYTANDSENEIADVLGVCFFSTGLIDLITYKSLSHKHTHSTSQE